MTLTNHLGKALALIGDRKQKSQQSTQHQAPEVVNLTDYYPFGMVLPGRSYSNEGYRYGFNGMEQDDELKGSGNSYDFGARMYDARIGRWLKLDPLEKKYPGLSPYAYTANNPVIFKDIDGRDFRLVIEKNTDGSGGSITLQSTIFLYGPSASEQLAADTQAKFDSMIEVYTYVDSDGKTWQVAMEITFQYAPELDSQINLEEDPKQGNVLNNTAPDDMNGCEGCDGPGVLDGIGYQKGDNFQYVDESIEWDGEIEQALDITNYGGPQGTTIKAVPSILVHASQHNIGVNDWRFQRSIMGISLYPKVDELTYIGIGEMGARQAFGSPNDKSSRSYAWRVLDLVTPEERAQKIQEQNEKKSSSGG